MAYTHNASCLCRDCRALRSSQHLTPPPQPGQPPELSPEPPVPTTAQSLAIRANPLEFVLNAKEEELFSNQEIINILVQAEVDLAEAESIVEAAEDQRRATRRRRGLIRMLKGAGIIALGLGAGWFTWITLGFGPTLGFTVVFGLGGMYQVIRGIIEASSPA